MSNPAWNGTTEQWMTTGGPNTYTYINGPYAQNAQNIR